MFRTVILMALLLPLSGAERLVVALRAAADIANPQATLAEVADLEGDADLVARLSTAVVQTLSDTTPHLLEPMAVRVALTRLAPGVVFAISGRCRVVRTVETIAPELLAEAVRAHVTAALQTRGDVRIEITRASAALSVPAETGDAVEIVADPLGPVTPGDLVFRVRVLRHTREVGRSLVGVRVRLFAEVPVAARAIAHGTVLGAGDARLERIEVLAHDAQAKVDLAALVGQQATRDIAEGAPLTGRLIQTAPAVRGGQAVTLVYRTDRIALTAVGIALGDGVIGDRIQIRRSTDGKTVTARISEPGQAEIEH